MVVTDLDGTLFQRQQRVSEANLRTLRRLGDRRTLRVIATGRNLYSARKVLPADFPVDFLVFSSGAGIMDWRRQRLIRALSMRRRELRRAFRALRGHGLDFMVHRPVPDSHFFVYFSSGRDNPDFQARLRVYGEFARPGIDGRLPMRWASQLLAIEPEGSPLHGVLRRDLEGLNVVRTTSPLDGRSSWVEIFPPEVSKSLASDWLLRRVGVERSRVLALGNDFNDLDLLEWAPRRYVMGGAAPELSRRFPQVAAGGEEDFSLAVARWEEELSVSSREASSSGSQPAEP